jgi:hypothetical protein
LLPLRSLWHPMIPALFTGIELFVDGGTAQV